MAAICSKHLSETTVFTMLKTALSSRSVSGGVASGALGIKFISVRSYCWDAQTYLGGKRLFNKIGSSRSLVQCSKVSGSLNGSMRHQQQNLTPTQKSGVDTKQMQQEKRKVLCKQCFPGIKLSRYQDPPPWKVWLYSLFGWEVRNRRRRGRCCNYLVAKQNSKSVGRSGGLSQRLQQSVSRRCKEAYDGVAKTVNYGDNHTTGGKSNNEDDARLNIGKENKISFAQLGICQSNRRRTRVMAVEPGNPRAYISEGSTLSPGTVVKCSSNRKASTSVSDSCKIIKDKLKKMRGQQGKDSLNEPNPTVTSVNLECHGTQKSGDLSPITDKAIPSTKNKLLQTIANSKHFETGTSENLGQTKRSDQNCSLTSKKIDNLSKEIDRSILHGNKQVTNSQPQQCPSGNLQAILNMCGLTQKVKPKETPDAVGKQEKKRDWTSNDEPFGAAKQKCVQSGSTLKVLGGDVTQTASKEQPLKVKEPKTELNLTNRYECGAGLFEEQIKKVTKSSTHEVNFRYRDHCKRKPGEEIPGE